MLRIKAKLHLHKTKDRASFYIPVKYQEKVKLLLHYDNIIQCDDFIKPVKFIAKLHVQKRKTRVDYSYHIPKNVLKQIKQSKVQECVLIIDKF